MENIFIAIVSDDKEYGRSLSLGMLNVCRGFIIRIFSAEEFMAAEKEFDIVLWDGEEVSRVYGGRIIYLAEKPSEVTKNISEKRFSIYKYSPAASIVAVIFEIYEALTGRHAVNMKTQNTRLFAVASYAGGTGCSTIAMAAAQELTRFHGKRVFYMSFEEFDSAGRFIRCNGSIKGAAVYLYELFKTTYGAVETLRASRYNSPFLEGRIVRDDYGTETFAPATGRNPLREVDNEEIDKLIAAVIDSGRYDAIIMDLGQWVSKTGIKCLEMSERICLIGSPDKYDIRESQYMTHLISCVGEDIINKVVKVVNDAHGVRKISEKEDDFQSEEIVVCRNSSFAYEEGVTRIVLEGEFGKAIKKLVDTMTEPI